MGRKGMECTNTNVIHPHTNGDVHEGECRLFRPGDFTDRIQGVSSNLVACGWQGSPNTSRKAFSIAIEEFQTSGTSQKYL